MTFFQSLFSWFLTWWGAFLIAALDASMLFFLPFGVDAVVIYLSASNEELFWLYPLLATAGSVVGAAGTYWLGKKIGEVGLERYVPERRLKRIRARVRESGAVAMALPALMPPPFPLTPFVLTCGALKVNVWRFLAIFGAIRLFRFGGEAILARVYGRGILRILQSDAFQIAIVVLLVIAVIGSIGSGIVLWRATHDASARRA